MIGKKTLLVFAMALTLVCSLAMFPNSGECKSIPGKVTIAAATDSWYARGGDLCTLISGGGAIINTASMWVFVGGALSCVYPVSKIGLLALSKHTAVKYAPHNIRVNCVCPGHIETPLIQSRIQDPEGRETLTKKYPLGRLGKPIDVAYAVLFLASEEASFITGTELVMDGGYTAQ